MPKAASTEIGQTRHYHFRYDGGHCECKDPTYSKFCRYSVPSVTTILKVVGKEWLGAWAAKMTAEYIADNIETWPAQLAGDRETALREAKAAPWRKRDAAAERGIAVHEAAEHAKDMADVPEAGRARYAQYQGFLELYRPTILRQEETVYDLTHRYAGTFDLIAEVGDETLLIDIKTSKDVYPEYRLQQAAYRYGEFVGLNDRRLSPVPRVDGVALLHLTDDHFQLIRVEAGQREYRAFLAAVTLHNFMQTSKADGKGIEIVLPQLTEVA